MSERFRPEEAMIWSRKTDDKPAVSLEDSPTPFETWMQAATERYRHQLEQPEAKAKLERQLRTIDTIAAMVQELQLQDSVYLLGGFTDEVSQRARPHDDVDLIVKGNESLQKVLTELQTRFGYSIDHRPDLENTSRRDLAPDDQHGLDFLDVRGVEAFETSGVEGWWYIAPDVEKVVGRPLGIPESAFSGPGDEIRPSRMLMRYIYPELGFLAKADSTKTKDVFDRGLMRPYLDQTRLDQIRTDAERANLALGIDERAINDVKAAYNK